MLISQKERIEELLSEAQAESKDTENEISTQEAKVASLNNDIDSKKKEIEKMEIDIPDFSKASQYKSATFKYADLKSSRDVENNKLGMLRQKQEHLKYNVRSLNNYLAKCTNKECILSSLNSLTNVYNGFGDDYGNIAYLCALVHYSLLDNGQLESFVSWSKQNGINKITDPDDLSKDASSNLIAMFDQIHQAKKNEIFISMQFGDSQSELIFEKIVRSIELFNFKHKDISLRATPIRIDRKVEASTSSIPKAIREAIKSCGLIIADLSSANINVYHEIGYAMGVAESNNMIPNIILLYKENTDHNKDSKDVDKFVGFNLRNLSQLRFREYDQLVEGLVKRLEKHYGV
ncbi:MAG: hypothetical protein J6W37_02345 [Bacteroidales bacterium]|nr:hypothetical protein [Bacteroidales bacterium]